MNDSLPRSAPAQAEEQRIRDAYARRSDRCYAESAAGRFQIQERERQALRLLDRHGFMPLSGKRILEVGSGSGHWLRDLVAWGADPENVFGVELLPATAARSRRLCAPGVTIACGSAADLDFETESFDLVLQSTMFTSILDPEMRQRIAEEMQRVVRPGGLILWNDFFLRNPRNRDVRPVGKREIHQLFPGCDIELNRVGLAPPLARALAPRSYLACYLLARIRPICTHYLGAFRKRVPALL